MKYIIALAALATLSGCATGMTRNGIGLIYTQVKDSITATEHAGGSKKGTACANNILALVSTGDMSIDTAKKNGSITKVTSVDYSQYSILGVYAETCAIVTGD
ncbi:MAG: TRL-like family protein [Bdellovibrio sp.]